MTEVWERAEIINFMEWLKEQGFVQVRLSINSRKSLCLSVQCQKLKHYEYGNTEMYFAEAKWEGEYCCVYTDDLEDREEILRVMKETAGIFKSRNIPESIKESKDFRGKRWRDIGREAVSEILKEAEREALSCEKAAFVEVCEYQQYEETVTLLDGDMHYLTDDDGDCTCTIRVIARDGDYVAASSKLGIVNVQDKEKFRETAKALAKRAAKYAGFGLHAEKLSSGTYPIVLENCVMAELTGHYLPVFYGENMKNHASVLTGKEKTQVGCPLLHLEENPFSSQGTRRRRIDDEGVTVSGRTLLRNGIFEEILHNVKSAAEAGTESTGHGFKPGLASDIGTCATNVILSSEGETFSRKEMLEASEGGIYITQIEGMFAGADTETGNFSLLASGNRIAGGKVLTAVNQFTVSGNICELWKDIEMIGNDPVYRISDGVCAVSPSVKVKSLVVSGE